MVEENGVVAERDKKPKNRILLIVLIILILAIVGLGVGILVVTLVQEDPEAKYGAIDSEKLNQNVSIVSNGFDLDEKGNSYKEDLIDYLSSTISMSKDDKDRFGACYYLSIIYIGNSEYEKAIQILNNGLSNFSLSDQDRYMLLSLLLEAERGIGNKDGIINALRLILALPEDMILEAQDWSMARQMYAIQLKEESGGEDE